MRRERAADVLLALSLFSCAASVPVSDTVWGGLFFHTALAAAVGGVADWFAVHSLFRRPLGIAFGTDVISQNRKKIIRMAKELLTEELLSVPRLYRLLKTHSLAAGAAGWISENEETVRALISEIIGVCASALDGRKPAAMTEEDVSSFIEREDWAQFLADESERLKPLLGGRRFLSAVSSAARIFLFGTLSETMLRDWYQASWEAYEEKGPMRGMLRGLLSSQLGLTDERAVMLMRQKIMELAADIENPDTESAQKVKNFCCKLSERLKTDKDFRQKVNTFVSSALISLWRQRGADFSADFLERKKEEMTESAADALYTRLLSALSDPVKRKAVDRWLLWQTVPYLPLIRDILGAAAETALSAYSDRDMAQIAENGVWHDLQMIRINGSLIGALLGALSFGLFYWVSGGVVL